MGEQGQEEMFFFIADISGYTAYMIQNQMAMDHGTLVINALIKTLVKTAEIPLEVSKLEGDAVFLFLPVSQLPQEMKKDPSLLTARLIQLFEAFSTQVTQLQRSTACDCGACSHISKLNLKVVGHYGKASIEMIGAFKELAGVDVILIHRLLKNQVKQKRYLLLTKAAAERLPIPAEGKSEMGVERDQDIGEIPVVIYYPPEQEVSAPKKELTFLEKLKSHWELGLGAKLLKWGIMKRPVFRNFPSKEAGK